MYLIPNRPYKKVILQKHGKLLSTTIDVKEKKVLMARRFLTCPIIDVRSQMINSNC